jgi:Arc/MetJ family transcription regulator
LNEVQGALRGHAYDTRAMDDELVAKARALTGLSEKSALAREALTTLIERETARRLAQLAGTEKSA